MELRAGYKLTDVGVIPNDWLTYTVRDLIELLTDYDANGSFESVAVNVKTYDYEEFAWYVRSTDLENNASLNNVKYVDEPSYKFLKKTSLYGGELLFLKRGDIGNVYLFEMKTERATVAPNLYLLKLNQISNSKYLYYYFVSQTGQKQLKSKNASSTLGALYKDDVKSIIVPLPPTKAEQTAIATALSDADALISSLEKLIAKKRNIKQGAMQKLLQPKEGWVVKKLGDSADIFRGGSPRPIESFLTTQPDGINWIKIGDVKKNAKYIESTDEKIISEGLSRSRFVNEGDFLLSNSMSFGRPYIMKISGCIHDGWLVIQNYQNNFDRDFLYYVLGSEAILQQYKAMASGSSVLNLNKEIVKNVIINCPKSVEEQTRIATILSDMDAEIQALETKLEKYRKIKLGMMQNLLTGKIRLV